MTASLASHIWDVSPAVDAVWAEVCGLGYEQAERRILSVWQIYVDESVGNDVFVLGGFVSEASRWAAFAQEWSQMLPYAVRSADKGYRFKMSEMAMNPERLERAQAFWRIIEKHVEFGISASLRLSDIRRAVSRVIVLTKDGIRKTLENDDLGNGYNLAFYYLLYNLDALPGPFGKNIAIPAGSDVELFFDQRQKERSNIIATWEEFVSGNGMSLNYSVPRFVDDDKFLPIQAADFLCWWTREWGEEANDLAAGGGLPWKQNVKLSQLRLSLTEDDIFEILIHTIRKRDPALRVFDRTTLVSSGTAGNSPLGTKNTV